MKIDRVAPGLGRISSFAAAALPIQPLTTPAATTSESVTFNRQIAPIICRNCSPCHRPGEAAPFALLSFQDVARKGKTIAKVTATHYLPPWKAEPASYGYRDERRLTDHEIAPIRSRPERWRRFSRNEI